MSAAGLGFLTEVSPWICFPACAALLLVLGFLGAPILAWTAAVIAILWGTAPAEWVWAVALVPLAIANIPVARAYAFSAPLMKLLDMLKIMPKISETERIALEAGSIWVDGELFSGRPDFFRIQKELYPSLTDEERAFIEGPVDELCRMTDDWDVYCRHDLSPETWAYIKRQRFLGMIIPKEFGGHGFSALCHSEVVQRLTTRSIPLAVSVMVPNSLGPGELILHYGTDEQKKYYLPRLARGEEIPCFALTEAGAGSDAGAMQSDGEVFRGDDGKLYVRINWDKRYITLAAVSTLIGLAIKLRDPNNLLGKSKNLGITCMLVPASTPGVVLGKRHNPMGVPFFNCPTSGKDVVVPIEQIIGGPEWAGQGWRMLMECLAAGRAISLPAQSTGSAKLVARVTSAYGVIREQFGLSIGKFEGIEDLLAQIGGITYMLEGMRRFTAGAVDQGMKPAVISAIAKYNSTELSRKLVIHGMDILGGAGISRGPRNLLANTYIGAPIGITVEGANILTRCMIIFGQGAIRCHPYAYKELQTLTAGDVRGFDAAFWGHVGHVVRNGCRALLLSLTRGHLAYVPGGSLRRYYRKLSWTSASFAFFADIAMGTLGGKLKVKEQITGRFADILSWMYLATATLRRFEAEGRQEAHRAFVDWTMAYAFNEIQKAFEGLFDNFNIPVIGTIFRWPVAIWSRFNRLGSTPSDRLGHRLVVKMMKPTGIREMLSEGIFVPTASHEPLARYEETYRLLHEADVLFKRIRAAVRAGQLPKKVPSKQLVEKAVEQGILKSDEAEIIRRAAAMREDAIQVDSFSLTEFQTGHMESRRPEAAV